MGVQGQHGRAVVQFGGAFEIGDRFVEAPSLGVGDALKRQRQPGIGFERQRLSSQLDRLVVAAREHQEHAPERVCPGRQRVEGDGAPHFADGLVVPGLAREIRGVAQAGQSPVSD